MTIIKHGDGEILNIIISGEKKVDDDNAKQALKKAKQAASETVKEESEPQEK